MWKSEEYFAFQGEYFKVDRFFLYTKPKTAIRIFCCPGKKAAAIAGALGDHLVTINSPQTCRDEIFPAFEQAAKQAGKDPAKMEKMVEVLLYFADKSTGIKEIQRSGEAGFLAKGAFNEVDPQENPKHVLHCGRRNNRKALALRHLTRRPHQNNRTIPASRRHTHRTSHTLTPRQNRTHRQKTLPHFKTQKHANTQNCP